MLVYFKKFIPILCQILAACFWIQFQYFWWTIFSSEIIFCPLKVAAAAVIPCFWNFEIFFKEI